MLIQYIGKQTESFSASGRYLLSSFVTLLHLTPIPCVLYDALLQTFALRYLPSFVYFTVLYEFPSRPKLEFRAYHSTYRHHSFTTRSLGRAGQDIRDIERDL